MKATIWVHNKIARVLVFGENGNVIDTNDDFNNRASAESWVLELYPEATVSYIFGSATERIKELNREWSYCVEGN